MQQGLYSAIHGSYGATHKSNLGNATAKISEINFDNGQSSFTSDRSEIALRKWRFGE